MGGNKIMYNDETVITLGGINRTAAGAYNRGNVRQNKIKIKIFKFDKMLLCTTTEYILFAVDCSKLNDVYFNAS